MTLILWTPPAERFPSLVSAVLARRELEWRAADLALELAGKLRRPSKRAKPGREKWRAIQPRALELFRAGLPPYRIALMTGTSEKTVRRALGLIGPQPMGVAEARAAAFAALAVRGGGRVASRMSR